MKHESWVLRVIVAILCAFLISSITTRKLVYAYTPGPPIQMTCPICGTRFLHSGAASMTILGTGLDLKPLGAVGPYCNFPVCPNDHFVLYKSEFKPGEIEILKKFISSSAYQDQIEDNSECYLLAKIYEFIGESSKKTAQFYLEASWQVENENPEKYKEYVSKSIVHFDEFLKKSKDCKKFLISSEILCAELERRLSRFDAARTRLSKVGSNIEGVLHREIISYELELINARDNAPHELPNVEGMSKASTHFFRGIGALSEDHYDQAIQEFNQAVDLEPDNPDALYHRSLAYREKGLYDNSIEDLNRLICIEPEKIKAFINRSAIYIRKGAYDKAIKDCDRAIQLDPKNASAYINRGIAYSHNGSYDKSIEDYDTALRLNPDNPETYWNRGIIHFLQGSFPKAAADFEQSLRQGRKDPFCAMFLFISRERSGQDGKKELTNMADAFDSTKWPAPIISMFLNNTSPETMLKEIQHSDDRTQHEQECEAFFFTGQYYFLKENIDEAKRMFQKSIDTGIKEFVEYQAAKHELKRLRD